MSGYDTNMTAVRFRPGSFVISKAGHDKDEIFIVIEEYPSEVMIADGKYRTLSKLKRKKKKHLNPINRVDVELAEAIDNKTIEDVQIRKALTRYKNEKKV